MRQIKLSIPFLAGAVAGVFGPLPAESTASAETFRPIVLQVNAGDPNDLARTRLERAADGTEVRRLRKTDEEFTNEQSVVKFFGKQTATEVAAEQGKADLLLGNNVLAHVPDLMDFVAGMKILLKPGGIITMEFPHLLQLMDQNQFDTIYHEHFSYFSFTTVEKVFAHHGITLFDVEELKTHGGSLRIFGRHAEDASKPVGPRVTELKAREDKLGFNKLDIYLAFNEKVKETKRAVLEFLGQAKRQGKKVVQYGAAGKANTLLNYCGIRNDYMEYAVDKNPYKQNNYLPGSRLAVYPPEHIKETKPDYLFIGVWNLKEEIVAQTSYIREWGGKWIVPIPSVHVVD